MAHFNLTLGFRADADTPIFSMIYDTFKDYDRVSNYTLPDWRVKHAQDTPMMSVWISNCGIETTHRMPIMEELASHGINMNCAPVLDVPVPGAHDIIVVKGEQGEVLIPFHRQFVLDVDLVERRVRVDWALE